jgi:hypothetical protein
MDRRRLLAIPTFAACAVPWVLLTPRVDLAVKGVFAGPLLWITSPHAVENSSWFPVAVLIVTLSLVLGSTLRPHGAWVLVMILAFIVWQALGLVYVNV